MNTENLRNKNARAEKISPLWFVLLIEKGAAHGFEFFDLFEKDVLGKLEMVCETGKTEEFRGTAVNQFAGQCCFIL